MKNNILLVIFTLFLLFCCKKVESEQNNQAVNYIGEDSKIHELISGLSGKVTKSQTEMFDASIMDLNGEVYNLSDYKGKVIFLNLWATWCPPCREEMPSIEKLYNDFTNTDFEILAVSQGEDKATVEKFLKNYNYTFPIFIDHNNEINKSYGTGAIPSTYVIDRNGFLIAQFIGGRDWNSSEVKELIRELLKQ